MSDRSTPTGPPPGPQWGQSGPGLGPTRNHRRPVLTHSLAALGGLLVGALLGIVGTGNGKDDSGSRPPASATVAPDTAETGTGTTSETETATETAPPARTTPPPAGRTTGNTKAAAQEIPGDGTFLVGQEVRPGTYRSAGPADPTLPNCYWARLKGTSGDIEEVLANGSGKGQATVTIRGTDKAFQTSGCQTWKRIG
ncbi:hypothetical protein [Streptomyces sp. NPDC093089]|uniref:hypothetical protein n=1 Tax=Streptomyces sp. NPDC093089 TaxID=3366024 RepID=UPI0038210531